MVREIRRVFRQKKVGHCGTLDPDATGLLLLTLGRATRLTRFLIRAPKIYEGTIRFGVVTDTYDASGQVLAERSTADLQLAAVASRMHEVEGTYQQVPPPYSAKKIAGRKFYELARLGEEVPQIPVEVQVFEFRPLGELDNDRLRFLLACSSGTYARSLAHELGATLGTGAHLEALRRTAIGDIGVRRAVGVETLRACEQPPEGLGDAWIPFDAIPLPFSEVALDARSERRVGHGQNALVQGAPGEEGDWLKLVNSRGQLVAVGTLAEKIGANGAGVVQPKIVFQG
jgi:tRNA pseudouridine55 synthase